MRPLTPIDVARRPAPGTSGPTNVAFSPSGATVTFLLAEPASLRRSLHAVDVATGRRWVVPTPGVEIDEAALSLAERLRRERARELGVGVTRYQWAPTVDRLLLPMADGLWVLDDPEAPAHLALDATEVDWPVLDAAFCGDGSTIGFVAGDEVWVVDAAGGTPRQVTAGARGTGRTHGLAEYIAQEEMGRSTGFWLSADGGRVAFCEVDETHIPTYRIVHQGSADPAAHEEHRYPFSGEANARVRLGVTDTDGSTPTRWLDLGATGIGEDRYLARVDWAGDRVVAQIQDRAQQRLDVVAYDLTDDDAEPRLLLSERSDVWINLHDLWRPLPDGGFLWASERSGFRHLQRHDPDGELVATLTSGDHVVTAVHAVTHEAVWCTTTAGDATGRQLWSVPLAGGEPTVHTPEPGVHASVVHGPSGARVITHTDLATPPVVTLHRGGGDAIDLHDAGEDPRLAEVGLTPPHRRTITAADGVTPLEAAVFRPDGPGPFPTVVWAYGGPHAQLVVDAWSLTATMRAQYLRQLGFCVAVVDNRGMNHRGLDFEAALHRHMGTVEVDDQVALVSSLVADGTTDPDRVGIYGWSYGGYLSALCLARRPDVFAAACAGAPVTSWDGYDTHYTERYMGTPQDNAEGYEDGSVMAHAEGIRGRRLLLVHGLIDENVHFRHTARLLDVLLRADIDHELVLYPDERHVPRHEADRVSMERRIAEFFTDALS